MQCSSKLVYQRSFSQYLTIYFHVTWNPQGWSFSSYVPIAIKGGLLSKNVIYAICHIYLQNYWTKILSTNVINKWDISWTVILFNGFKIHMTIVSFSSCQRNLIKTFQIDGMIALITKMDLIFSWDLLNGQK